MQVKAKQKVVHELEHRGSWVILVHCQIEWITYRVVVRGGGEGKGRVNGNYLQWISRSNETRSSIAPSRSTLQKLV